MKICAYYMVKDEAFFLKYILPFIRNYVDYIYILDTGSTDNTVEIAKRYADHVDEIDTREEGYFGKMFDIAKYRNMAMDNACALFNFDLFLSTDGDESWNPKFFEVIKNIDWNKYDGICCSTFVYFFEIKQDTVSIYFALKNELPVYSYTGNQELPFRKILVESNGNVTDDARKHIMDGNIRYDSHEKLYKKHLRFIIPLKPTLHQRVIVEKKYMLPGFYHYHFGIGKKYARLASSAGLSRVEYAKAQINANDPTYTVYKTNLNIENDFGFDLKSMIKEYMESNLPIYDHANSYWEGYYHT